MQTLWSLDMMAGSVWYKIELVPICIKNLEMIKVNFELNKRICSSVRLETIQLSICWRLIILMVKYSFLICKIKHKVEKSKVPNDVYSSLKIKKKKSICLLCCIFTGYFWKATQEVISDCIGRKTRWIGIMVGRFVFHHFSL